MQAAFRLPLAALSICDGFFIKSNHFLMLALVSDICGGNSMFRGLSAAMLAGTLSDHAARLFQMSRGLSNCQGTLQSLERLAFRGLSLSRPLAFALRLS
jgi:hypothetical protein